jgi:hypothetical protein
MRATISAGTTDVLGRNARTAHAVLTNLGCGAAVCARVTGTIATGVPRTADRSGGRTGAFVAKPFVLGSITGTFVCRRRIGAKHLLAPLRTIPISAEDAAYAAQAEEATDGGGDDKPESMAARSRAGQGFRQFVKVRRLHFDSLLQARDCAVRAQAVKLFFNP